MLGMVFTSKWSFMTGCCPVFARCGGTRVYLPSLPTFMTLSFEKGAAYESVSS